MHRVFSQKIKFGMGDRKILFVAPHLSTGGLPQYLLHKITEFNAVADVYCVEYNFYGDAYVVQRNRIQEILGSRFHALMDDKKRLLEIIGEIKPDVIHFEEFCESFVDEKILLEVFSEEREYFIFETCHSSITNPSSKIFRPDKLIMVSKWIADKFENLGIPIELLEYPILDFVPDKQNSREKLGLSSEQKHVINVGLFTSGKNQSEVIDYARQMEDLPVVFHFIGNTAANFKDYWEPLLEKLPANCKVWGERADVENFYQAGDLLLFTSNLELNPLCLKEALSWKIPCIFKKLETYLDSYDQNPLVTYLTQNREANLELIKNKLGF